VALSISVVAEFYSIAGLTAIFSAAVIPTIIMGVVLALGKLTATIWLKLNWERAPLSYKLYLIPAIAVLMFLTSMGIFGFLSKAHSDQSLVSGDVQSKIALYDDKIKVAKENIDANRKALKQMDEAVDQVMGRSTDEKGADKAVSIRRGQQKERSRLLSEIEAEQKKISSLSEERAPIAAEVRKVENEVGPLKYIAALIYGDNPDANLLESAVRWVIIIIVAVFDPLALILLLAAQQSFRWDREREEQEKLDKKLTEEKIEEDFQESVDKSKLLARELDRDLEQRNIDEANALLATVEKKVPEVIIPPPVVDLVAEANNKIAEIEREHPEFIIPEEPKYEQDDGPLTDDQITQLKKEVALFVPEESDPTIECRKCGTELLNAPGIGPFCPNKQCDVFDGPFIEEAEPLMITYIPPEPVRETVSIDERPGDYLAEPTIEKVDVSSDGVIVESTVVVEEEPIIQSIDTDGVTEAKIVYDTNAGYVIYEGKKMSITNLQTIRPELIVPDSFPNKIEFGTVFPKYSLTGDTFIRVDVVPHRVYKFISGKWIDVDKEKNITYLSNETYIQHLINKLDNGEYDAELLTGNEQYEIELFLTKGK
jgi:hypothetical protein